MSGTRQHLPNIQLGRRIRRERERRKLSLRKFCAGAGLTDWSQLRRLEAGGETTASTLHKICVAYKLSLAR